MEAKPFCCRCSEDFPVSEDAPWAMGKLRSLSCAPLVTRQWFAAWLDHPEGAHLCGNCYFDLTDELV